MTPADRLTLLSVAAPRAPKSDIISRVFDKPGAVHGACTETLECGKGT